MTAFPDPRDGHAALQQWLDKLREISAQSAEARRKADILRDEIRALEVRSEQLQQQIESITESAPPTETDTPIVDETPPSALNKNDYIVEACIKRCIASGRPLASLADVLTALALAPTWTQFDLCKLRNEVLKGLTDRIPEPLDAQDVPPNL